MMRAELRTKKEQTVRVLYTNEYFKKRACYKKRKKEKDEDKNNTKKH